MVPQSNHLCSSQTCIDCTHLHCLNTARWGSYLKPKVSHSVFRVTLHFWCSFELHHWYMSIRQCHTIKVNLISSFTLIDHPNYNSNLPKFRVFNLQGTFLLLLQKLTQFWRVLGIFQQINGKTKRTRVRFNNQIQLKELMLRTFTH